MKRIIALILSVSLLAALCACGRSARASQKIIEELILTYGQFGSESNKKVNALLKELSSVDAAEGEKWREIMDVWEYAELGVPVNVSVLPNGLPDDDELCIVALGFQLNEDGSMRDELIERLKVVLACAERYPNALIVCTGGGTAKNDPAATEAGRMAEWLIDQGVDVARVIVEDKSLTTAQNAQNTLKILSEDYPQVRSLAIVSSDYHIATGTLFFEAECILRAAADGSRLSVVSNAAYAAPKGNLSRMFQAGGLIELAGDIDTAFDIYYETYDIHKLPTLN